MKLETSAKITSKPNKKPSPFRHPRSSEIGFASFQTIFGSGKSSCHPCFGVRLCPLGNPDGVVRVGKCNKIKALNLSD